MIDIISFLKYIKNYHIQKNCELGKNTVINYNTNLNCVRLGDFSSIQGKTTLHSSVVGKYCIIGYLNRIYNSSINDYSYTGFLTTVARTSIGKFCSIANKVSIGATKHPLSRISTHPFTYYKNFGYLIDSDDKDIADNIENTITNIGNDVWIGHGAIIMPDISIGNGAIVGAGSVVTKNVPAYAIVTGVPAKILKFRFSPEFIEKLEISQWWNWSRDELQKKVSDFRSLETFFKL